MGRYLCYIRREKVIHHGDSIPKSYSTLSLDFTVLTSTVLFVLKSKMTVKKHEVYAHLVPRQYVSPARRCGTVVSRLSVPNHNELMIP